MSHLIPAFVITALSSGLVVTPAFEKLDSLPQHLNGHSETSSIQSEAVQVSPQSLQASESPDTPTPTEAPSRGDRRRGASA